MSSLLLTLVLMDAERPAPLPDRAGCEHFRGTARGNDPSVELDVVLCPTGDDLHGEVQWSSLQSGWNRRRVAGSRVGDTVRLHDLEVTEERPQPGWRFCEIDAYELVRTDTGLRGSYRSAACDDRADLSLERVPAGPGERSEPDAPVPTRAPEPDAAPRSRATAEDPRSGCGCSAAAFDATWPWGIAVLGLWIGRRRR